jgi:plastocyanin
MYLRNIALVLLVSLMAVALAACGGGTAAPTATTVPPATTAPTGETPAGAADYTIQLKGGGTPFFDPKDLTLTAGQTYAIKLVADGEFHTWSVKNPAGGYFADVQVNPNTTQTVAFTAPAAGTYKLICIPHETLKMVGTITVK